MRNIIAERVKDAKLTKSQRTIAEFFVQNQERIGAMSSLDAAREIGVSDASVIRFSRAIGFDGFTDLKNSVYSALVESAYSGLSLAERLTQNKERYSSSADPEKFRQLMHQNIDEVFRNNAIEDFSYIASALVDAEHRYIAGLRGCRGAAMQFGRLLSFMLPHVSVHTDGEPPSQGSMQDISEKDVLLLFVYSRFYKDDLLYVELARSHGARVILVTDAVTGPLNTYADRILITSSSSMSFFHSTVGTHMIGEYLLHLVGSMTDFRERIEERDRITEDHRL